jgi:hypothetical protein
VSVLISCYPLNGISKVEVPLLDSPRTAFKLESVVFGRACFLSLEEGDETFFGTQLFRFGFLLNVLALILLVFLVIVVVLELELVHFVLELLDLDRLETLDVAQFLQDAVDFGA